MEEKKHIIDRFISYVTIDTESNPNSNTTPSTEKQRDVANKLVEEQKQNGMEDVSIDENAYIMATLPSNVDHEDHTIGFISYFDTSPDYTRVNKTPQIIDYYDCGDLTINDEIYIILSANYFEELLIYNELTHIRIDVTTILSSDHTP